MPIHTIQVSEYECVHCGYKWINRVNGKDGPVPKNCAKCKRFHWNGKGEGSGYNPITPRESGLRVRLYKFEGHRDVFMGQIGRQYRPNELCEKFLSLNPRPTMQELYDALYPLGWDPRNSKYKNCIPDPEKPGYLKYDLGRWKKDPKTGEFYKWNDDPNFVSDYEKLLKEESLKRREFMKKVITSRGEKVPKMKTEKEWEDARNEKLAKVMEFLSSKK